MIQMGIHHVTKIELSSMKEYPYGDENFYSNKIMITCSDGTTHAIDLFFNSAPSQFGEGVLIEVKKDST